MDTLFRLGLAVFATSILLPAAAEAQSTSLHRKPGWWSITVTTLNTPMTMQLCTNEAVEKRSSIIATNPTNPCTPAKVTPSPKGYAFEAKCTTAAGPMTMTGIATGDFTKAYRVDMVTTMPKPPIPALARVTSVMKGTYLGACPAGRKPGDVVMDKRVTNLLGGTR